ncbi:MAG TPA: hypothetical protein VEU29_01180 [Actinomycetota bacterium]|nr:hypothetical protein [Actinomycetota bacterium]
MRRRFAGALVGALVAGSISMAAPAQAQEQCELVLADLPQEELISTGSPIQIYAGRVPGYALAVAGWAGDFAGCVSGYVVSCAGQAGPQLPLVEVDPETLTVTIYDQNVIGNTSCLFGPDIDHG